MKKITVGSLVIALLTGLCMPVLAQELVDKKGITPEQREKIVAAVKKQQPKGEMLKLDFFEQKTPMPPCEVEEDAVYHLLDGVLIYDEDYVGSDGSVSAVYEVKLARSAKAAGSLPAVRLYVFAVRGAQNLDPDFPNNGDTADLVSSLYGKPLAETVSLFVFTKKDLSDVQEDYLRTLGETSKRYRVIDSKDELAVLALPERGSEKTYAENFSGEFFPNMKFCGSNQYLKLADLSVVLPRK